MRTLHRSLIRTAHRSPFRFAMGDKRRPRMKWGGALLSAIFLARRLAQHLGRAGNGRAFCCRRRFRARS